LAICLLAPPALAADPCTAIPDNGALPGYVREHVPFRGSVVHIIDGDGLCVATGQGQNTWVEVRLENFFAPELSEGGRHAKAVLARIALGQPITCVPRRGMSGKLSQYDRVFARCQLGRRDLGDLMRAAGVREGGRGREPRH
jgi:endonuclease YncB( thermonuclease family)